MLKTEIAPLFSRKRKISAYISTFGHKISDEAENTIINESENGNFPYDCKEIGNYRS